MRCFRWLVILLFVVTSLAVCGEMPYGNGWTEWRTDAAEELTDVKCQAKRDNRPVILYVTKKDDEDCRYCKAAWQRALCDGLLSHSSTGCIPSDSDYGEYPVKGWSGANRIAMVAVKEASIRKKVLASFKAGLTDYPMVFLLHVKSSADETDGCLLADDADVVGAFSLRSGYKVNGVSIGNPLSFKDFARVVESYFPNDYWASCGEAGVIHLSDMPCKSKAVSRGGLCFTAEESEHVFSFDGKAGVRYDFYGYRATSDDLAGKISYDFYRSSDMGHALKSGSGSGTDVLSRGINLNVTEEGTYYLRITGEDYVGKEPVYTLTYHSGPIPEAGDLLDPAWSGAESGKWTMDLDGARAAALKDGKDMVVYFSGALWCPHCLLMEYNFIDTESFRAWSSDKYLVLIDNRMRLNANFEDGMPWRPSLLLDDSSGGYLDRHGLTLEQGKERLRLNNTTNVMSLEEWQAAGEHVNDDAIVSQFLEPGATATDDKPIGYPTLIYVTNAGANDERVVGRLKSMDDGTETEMLQIMMDLEAQAGDVLEEVNNYIEAADLMDIAHVDCGSVVGMIGGYDDVDWYQVSEMAVQELWRFELCLEEDGASAELWLTDSKGGEMLAFSDTGRLSYVASEALKGARLMVTSEDLTGLTNYGLSWERVEGVQTLLSFSDASMAAGAQDKTIQVTLVARSVSEATSGMTVALALTVPEGLHAVLSSDIVSWSAAERNSEVCKTVSILLEDCADEVWSGFRNIQIAMTSIEGAGAVIEEPTQEVIRVYSAPTTDGETTVDMTNMVEGIGAEATLAVYCGLEGTLAYDVTAGQLPDWLQLAFDGEGTERRLVIRGIPEAKHEMSEVTIQLSVTGAEGKILGDSVTLRLAASWLSEVNPYAVDTRFGGYFYRDSSTGGRRVFGRLAFGIGTGRESQASVSSVIGASDGGLVGTLDDLDGVTGVLSGTLTGDGLALHIAIGTTGRISGYMNQEGACERLEFIGFAQQEVQPLPSAMVCFAMPSCTDGLGAGAMYVYPLEDSGAQSFGWNVDWLGVQLGEEEVAVMTDGNGNPMMVLWGTHSGSDMSVGAILTLTASASEDQYAIVSADYADSCFCLDGEVFDISVNGRPFFDGKVSDVFGQESVKFWMTMTANDGVTAAMPVGLELFEDSTGCLQSSGVEFGSVNLLRLDGCCWLSGVVHGYFLRETGKTETRELNVLLALVPLAVDCCSVDMRPVAVGHGFDDDGCGVLVEIYCDGNDYQPPCKAAELDVASSEKYSDASFSVSPNGWLLSLSGDEAVLACNDGGSVQLPSGDWTMMNLGESLGEYAASSSTAVTVLGRLWLNTLDAPWRIGWNCVALPWQVGVVHEDSKDELLKRDAVMWAGGCYQRALDVQGGCAYWIYLSEVPSEAIAILYDGRVQEPLPGSGWHFCAQPGQVWGWRWDGRHFELTKEFEPGQGGWFKLE